jgi:hypothetical protein
MFIAATARLTRRLFSSEGRVRSGRLETQRSKLVDHDRSWRDLCFHVRGCKLRYRALPIADIEGGAT